MAFFQSDAQDQIVCLRHGGIRLTSNDFDKESILEFVQKNSYEPFEKLTKQKLNNLISPYIAFFIFDPKNSTHVADGERVK